MARHFFYPQMYVISYLDRYNIRSRFTTIQHEYNINELGFFESIESATNWITKFGTLDKKYIIRDLEGRSNSGYITGTAKLQNGKDNFKIICPNEKHIKQ
jgi:hypothetical protein